MKKLIKNKIFLVIITLLIGVSGTLYAASIYYATDVIYNPSTGESMSVNDALNDLYKSKSSVSTEQVKIVVSSIYNGETKQYKVSGKSIYCNVNAGNVSTEGANKKNFTYDSDKIKIYETPDGEMAVLNTIYINVHNTNSHTTYSYEGSSSSSSYAITLENGTVIRSGSTIAETISLFNETIGDSEYLNITATGYAFAQGGTWMYSNAKALAAIDDIVLTYILIK